MKKIYKSPELIKLKPIVRMTGHQQGGPGSDGGTAPYHKAS